VSARCTHEHPGEPGRGNTKDATRKTGRHAHRTPRITVTDPKMTVVESAEPANSAALATAMRLFVKWAIRAHESANPEAPEAPTDHLSAD